MIDKPENGHNPEMRDKGVDPARGFQTTAVVAHPDTQPTQPPLSNPGTHPENVTPMTAPMSDAAFSSELTKFQQSFGEIQAEFLGAPRAAVEKAEALIDGLMNALHDQLQRIHGNIKTEADTEQLRVAMLSYRELFGSLGGRRAA